MAVFLRILLSLALVLNGTAGAWAMPMDPHPAPSAPEMHSVADESATPPCHQHARMAMPDEAMPSPDSDLSDCCQSAACQCACAHLPAAAFAIAFALSAQPPASVLASLSAREHATPPLPHEIRPPIV